MANGSIKRGKTGEVNLDGPLALEEEKFQRSKILAGLEAVSSPMRHVPPEILLEIFQCCINNSLTSRTYSVTNPLEAPILLGHICSAWRSISRNTPRLWDRISFNFDEKNVHRAALYVNELAERSQPLPVSVMLTTPRVLSLAVQPFRCLWPLEVMWPLTDRLKEIDLTVAYRDLVRFRLSVNKIFPILRRVSIDFHPVVPFLPSNLAEILNVFGSAPRLCQLRLNFPTARLGDNNLASSKFPWAQLTTLDLRIPMDVLAARSILMQCIALQICVMHAIEPTDDDDQVLALCTLYALRSLQVFGDVNGPHFALLRPLRLPALESLEISGIEASEWPRHVFLDLHARAAFTLTALALYGLDLALDDLLAFLLLTPALASLSLKYCACVCNELFVAFTRSAEDLAFAPPIALPVLAQLTLGHDAKFDGDAVVTMVESLYGSAAFPMFTRVELIFDGAEFDDGLEERLEDMFATGFLVDSRC